MDYDKYSTVSSDGGNKKVVTTKSTTVMPVSFLPFPLAPYFFPYLSMCHLIYQSSDHQLFLQMITN